MFEHSSVNEQQYKDVSACKEQRLDGPAVWDLFNSTTPKKPPSCPMWLCKLCEML